MVILILERERFKVCDKCSVTERQRQLYLEMNRTGSEFWHCHFVTLDKSPNIYNSCNYSKRGGEMGGAVRRIKRMYSI